MDFDEIFHRATTSIFRFEGLQDYTAEDGEEITNHFISTGKLLHHPKDSKWWQMMKGKNEAGIKTSRVRLVTLPVNNYTKLELAYLTEVDALGGDTAQVIEGEKFSDLFPEGLPDYWMIDNKWVMKMNYGPRGKWLGYDLIEGKEVKKYVEAKDILLRNSIPVANYDA